MRPLCCICGGPLSSCRACQQRRSPLESLPATIRSASCFRTLRCTIYCSATRQTSFRVPGPGHDQRQPERRAHRGVEPPRRCSGSAASPIGSCCTTATSPCASTIRWCAPSRAANACCGARAASSPTPSTSASQRGRSARLRRRAEEHVLPHQGPLRHPQPAHRRPARTTRPRQFFEETLARMKHLFRVEPRAVAHDLHPGYWSTRMALASAIERKIGVQHHHAHIASCMAENHLRGKVIGVAFDGTGYGTDGKHLGRRIPGRRFRRLHPARPSALRPAARRRRGGPPALAHGPELSARRVRPTEPPADSACFRSGPAEADRAGRRHAREAHPDGRDILLRAGSSTRWPRCSVWPRK